MHCDNSLEKNSLIEQIFDPTSDLYLDNLLDLATSISYDIHCSGTWKNSKPIKAFLERYSNYADKIYKSRVSLNDFTIMKTVGQGGFGRVDLVRHKQSNDIYAMKVMDKSTFVQNSFNGFWEERDIMAKNSSDWLIKCFYTFMDLRKLYIVMEYMPGGDLYHWMGILEDFSDEQTHFYAMEMVLAVEVLHNMGFIHRDLKPDNMLLDKNGHLKLADFGTCIRVQNGKVKTNFQVGTPDYISPEVLRNTGLHDLEVGFEIDWWAYGIVIYELFYGETPFEGESTSTLYRNIMCYKSTLVYPDDKPGRPEFIDFLSKILTEPNERMAIIDIKNHPYLTSSSQYKWTLDTIRQHQSPVMIEVSGDDDTNNITFDPADRRNNMPSLLTNNNYFSGENLAFSGFTFNRNDRYRLAGEVYAAGNTDKANSAINTELEKQLADIQLARQQLIVKLDSTNAELAKSQSSLSRLERDLAEKDQLISAKKADYATMTENNKQLRLKFDMTTKQLELVQRELDQIKVTLVERDGALRTIKLDNANLADEIATLQTTVQARDDKLEKLICILDEKSVLVDQLTKSSSLLDEERVKNLNLSTELANKTRKIIEYESQLEVLNNNAITIAKAAPVATAEELERLIIEKQKLEVRLTHLANDVEHAEKLCDAVQAELASEKQKKVDLEKSREKLMKDLANQKFVTSGLQSRLNLAEDQKKVMRQKINVIESEKDQIEQQKTMFQSMVEVRKTENDGLLAELDEAQELFEAHQRDMEAERSDWHNKFADMQEQLNELRLELSSRAKQLEQFQLVKLENDHLLQQAEKLRSELDERGRDLSELSRLTVIQRDQLDKNDKQIGSDKAKISSLVLKIDEMIKNPKSMPQLASQRKKKDTASSDAFRRVKLLESELSKEKAKLQEKYKEITEVKNECQHWQEQCKELRGDLDNKVSTIKDLKANLNGLMMQRSTGASDQATALSMVELKTLEGKMDILKKGKGRHKIAWNSSYGSLKPFKLDIFQNETDNYPMLTIDLRSVIHIREPSAAECVHIDKAMLPQILQIIYEKPEVAEESRRQSMISSANNADASRRNKSLTIHEDSVLRSPNSTLSSSSMNESMPLPPNGIYNIENHSFVPMKFRSYTNCDLCHISCSDLLNPPLALECGNCKKRIHFEHISLNDFKIQWCQGAIETIIFKVESREAKLAWLNSLNQFKEYQKTNEIQVAPNTFYRSMRNNNVPQQQYPSGNLNIP